MAADAGDNVVFKDAFRRDGRRQGMTEFGAVTQSIEARQPFFVMEGEGKRQFGSVEQGILQFCHVPLCMDFTAIVEGSEVNACGVIQLADAFFFQVDAACGGQQEVVGMIAQAETLAVGANGEGDTGTVIAKGEG